MTQNNRLRLLSYAVIIYMLLAFAWWSVLLFTKNQDAFAAKRDQLRLIMIANGAISNDEEAFLASPPYQALEKQYTRQEWMIMGEAMVFVVSLVIGLWLINRGYHKEVSAAQQRRNFLLSITHELKSPIASIQLVLETLRKRNLKKELADKLTTNGLVETERLNKLVNDLLLSAKLESAYQPHMEAIDLADLIEQIVARQQDKHAKATIRFIQESPVQPFQGDRTGMTSVVTNLIENAVKYAGATPLIEASIQQEDQAIILQVADNGLGIPDKEKPKIFEKFYRIGNEDTRKTKGTGLGLYIVKEIVKAHKGQIMVEDNHPQGTRFRITLPVPIVGTPIMAAEGELDPV
jgi:two-component system phosphate regulon sensor histidine kinase PhoR